MNTNFKRWFGSSKVVDATGAPLVVYHGTNADIEVFDLKRSGQNYRYAKRGFFFSQKASAAAEYAMEGAQAYGGQPPIPGLFNGTPANPGKGTANIMPVYLSLQNPLIVSARGNRSPEQWFDFKHEDLYAKAEATGADGIIVKGAKNSGFEGRTLYLSMRPEQVKSATGNSGAYDPADPDITDRRALAAQQAKNYLLTLVKDSPKISAPKGAP